MESRWSYAQLATLWELSRRNLSPRDIAVRLAKSEDLVLEKAAELGISFPLSAFVDDPVAPFSQLSGSCDAIFDRDW